LSGWLIAATVPLLSDASAIDAWARAGLHDGSRLGLAVAEIVGAALFAFELPVVAGFTLLIGSFVVAAAIHVHSHMLPWQLAFYSLAAISLLYCTRSGSGR